jgi:hypothetical protein
MGTFVFVIILSIICYTIFLSDQNKPVNHVKSLSDGKVYQYVNPYQYTPEPKFNPSITEFSNQKPKKSNRLRYSHNAKLKKRKNA